MILNEISSLERLSNLRRANWQQRWRRWRQNSYVRSLSGGGGAQTFSRGPPKVRYITLIHKLAVGGWASLNLESVHSAEAPSFFFFFFLLWPRKKSTSWNDRRGVFSFFSPRCARHLGRNQCPGLFPPFHVSVAVLYSQDVLSLKAWWNSSSS